MKLRKAAIVLAAALTAASTAGCTLGQVEKAGETSAKAASSDREAMASSGDIEAEEGSQERASHESQNPAQAQKSQDPAKAQETGAEASEEENEEDYTTGDASLDNPRNQDEIGEKELLVVSFGTSYNDSRRLTIGAIEEAMEQSFPDYSVRRGFTSQIIIDRVKNRDHIAMDNVKEALERARDNGVKELVIQPTHLMDGLEYGDLVEEAAQYSDAFEKVAVGKPLLTSEEDFKAVAQAIAEDTAQYDDGDTAICFMGHGTEAQANQVYAKMQETLSAAGYDHYYVGTVEASPSLEDVMEAVKKGGYKRVVLKPLMIVAGDHANNDMAGDDEDSWKNIFEKEGYEVICLLNGLGELEAVQQLFADHARAAIDSLSQ